MPAQDFRAYLPPLPSALPAVLQAQCCCPLHPLTHADGKAKPVRKRGGKVQRRGITQIDLSGPTKDYFGDMTKLTDASSDAIRKALLADIDKLLPPLEDGDDAEAIKGRSLKQIARSVKQAHKRIEKLQSFAERTAKSAASTTQQVHKSQQAAQLAQIGIEVFNETPGLPKIMGEFVRVNTKLIKSIPRDELRRVEAILVDAVKRGRRHESVAKDIAAEFDIAENRAALIARDQVGKANSDLSKSRMIANGVDKAIWRVIAPGESRVRETHAAREGRVYKIANGVDGVHPGDEVQCRCYAEPLV